MDCPNFNEVSPPQAVVVVTLLIMLPCSSVPLLLLLTGIAWASLSPNATVQDVKLNATLRIARSGKSTTDTKQAILGLIPPPLPPLINPKRKRGRKRGRKSRFRVSSIPRVAVNVTSQYTANSTEKHDEQSEKAEETKQEEVRKTKQEEDTPRKRTRSTTSSKKNVGQETRRDAPKIQTLKNGGETFLIPRTPARPTLEPGTIETNVTVLNTSISVLRHRAIANGELFCYIRGACRLGNGKYLLPAWMKKHSDTIARCGLSRVMYVLYEGESQLDHDVDGSGRPRKVILLKGFPRANVNVSDEFRNMDILGNEPPRPEWQYLVADLTPRILLADMFLRPGSYKNETSVSCFTQSGGNCTSDAMIPRTLNISLLVDVGLSGVKDHKWPKGIIRLLRNGFEGSLRETDLADIYGFRFRNHASCFRSILTTNATFESMVNTGTIRRDNFMYRANALSRESVVNLEKMDRRRCHLKVLILDRISQGRIMGLKILKDALKMLNVKLTRHYPMASVQAEAVYFQNISFHEQISVMQETDIAIGTNTELNANLPFLRPNATFFEILPFGIHPYMYRTLANAYDVQYRSVSAFPDTELFERCIEHYNDDIGEERKLLLAHWRYAAQRFVNASRDVNKVNESAPAPPPPALGDGFYLPEDGANDAYGELRNIRTCAELQRLSANVKELAKQVFNVAMDKCGIQSQFSKKTVFLFK